MNQSWIRRAAAASAAMPLALGFAAAGVATPAAAATPDCAYGYSCLWNGTAFEGGAVGVSTNNGNLSGHSMDNRGTSGQANGADCFTTRFYTGYTADGSTYMFLVSSSAYPDSWENYASSDGNLASAPVDAWGNSQSSGRTDWNNVISSWRYLHC
ncbi:peptidase inhibitor family I36 protein [Myceligenerans crystallogenes]|uniref:Peptidase inhibitor family I36 n=1 Tax=Myceligenerans crystallogenes TaxID=316335 RepID=A0ABP4ZPI6_9MICO